MSAYKTTELAASAIDLAAQLTALSAAVPIGVSIVDRDLRYVQINERLAEINGYTVDEHLGRTLHELFPTAVHLIEPYFRRVLDTGESVTDVEVVAETPARPGVERTWIASYHPVRGADGSVDGVAAIVREVTEERKLDAARDASDSQKADVLERVADGFVALDRDWHYTYVNAKAGEFFNRRPEDLVGRHIWTEFPDGIGQPFNLAYEQAMRDQQPVTFEDYYEPWDRWFENRVYPSPDGVSIFFTEITERRRAERALERDRRRIEAIHQLEASIVRADDPSHVVRSALGAVRDLLGTTYTVLYQFDRDAGTRTILEIVGPGVVREEAIGRTAPLPPFVADTIARGEPVILPDLREVPGDDPSIAGALQQGTLALLILPLPGPEPLLLSANWPEAHPVREGDLEVLREIGDTLSIAFRQSSLYAAEHDARVAAETAADRTQRLQSVTDLSLVGLEADRLLHELADRVRAALDADTTSVLLVADDGMLDVVASVGLEEEVGAVRIPLGHGFTGTVAAERRTIVLDDVPDSTVFSAFVRERVRTLIGTPLVVGNRVVGVVSVGSERAREFSPDDRALLELAASRAAGAIERARLLETIAAHAEELEERVEERTRQLSEINAELDAFSYTVSHDLRAPLRAMEGFAGALVEDEGERLSPMGREFAERIVTAGHRMEQLIGDLLEYSRISRVHFQPETVDLDAAVATAVHQLEATLGAAGAEVVVERPLGAVTGHRASVTQAIANLVANAAKFVAPGSAPRIRVTAERRSGHVRLTVADNGIGIAPEHLDRIFRVFERLHGQESFAGTGIGLAIVRKAVERMSGTVGVESTPGEGSRFWIELPAATPGEEAPT